MCIHSFTSSLFSTTIPTITSRMPATFVSVICGYGMMFLSMFLTIIAYSGMDFTNVQIVEATGYIMVLILSYFFFHEKITKRKVLGMALIFAGIAVYYL